MKALLKWWRQHWCSHAVYYDTDGTERDSSGNLSCPCYKCGKVLVADCYIHMDADLHRRDQLHPASMESPGRKPQ